MVAAAATKVAEAWQGTATEEVVLMAAGMLGMVTAEGRTVVATTATAVEWMAAMAAESQEGSRAVEVTWVRAATGVMVATVAESQTPRPPRTGSKYPVGGNP